MSTRTVLFDFALRLCSGQAQGKLRSGQGSEHRADWYTYLVQQVTSSNAETWRGGEREMLVHLVSTYGTDYTQVLALASEGVHLRQPIVSGLPYLWAEVQRALQHEMALTLEDVLGRRTHILDQAPNQGLEVANQVAAMMAAELGWSAEEQAAQVDHYRRVVEGTRRWRSV